MIDADMVINIYDDISMLKKQKKSGLRPHSFFDSSDDLSY